MLARACERDAMARMYIDTTPDRAAPQVSSFDTFQSWALLGPRVAALRSQTSDFDIFVDVTTERRFRPITRSMQERGAEKECPADPILRRCARARGARGMNSKPAGAIWSVFDLRS